VSIRVLACVVFGLLATSQRAQRAVPDPGRPVGVFVLDLAGDGYQLSSVTDGVSFDLDGTGTRVRTAWTRAGADDGFLFLDTNGNAVVDNGQELLGNGWRRRDGSRVVSGDTALLDIQGLPDFPAGPVPPGTSFVQGDDAVFEHLRFWCDRNHDGKSDAAESQPLSKVGIVNVYLGFKRLRRTPDAHGNIQLNEGSFSVRRQGIDVVHRMLEVEFAREGRLR
jgi:hypothetical protein